MTLKLIYCSKAAKSDWRRRDRRASHTHSKLGQRYAEEIRPGVWMCLCCCKRVKVIG